MPALRPNTYEIPANGRSRRAAAYARMSTDHQRYSIENQMQAISDYAHSRGIEIVRTYADAGRTGLTLHGRDALRHLISDVREGRADFALVLVYDVSRWGRFQDVDESAHYEFICKSAGVRIEYCAEGFHNDGSLVATLMKGMKRVMAGEYSRELSAKTFAGHRRLAQMGFHQGGAPGYGLRRVLIDRYGRPKQVLATGQAKNLQDDRVILIRGPLDEVRTVRKVFKLYVEEGLSQKRIARILNQQGARNSCDNLWTQHNVNALLRNERYIGNLVYNRTSLKLRSRRIKNQSHEWIRSKAVIDAIIEPKVFASAQLRLNASWEISDADLLNHLTAVWCIAGQLSSKSMETIATTPAPKTYQARFGGLQNAYLLIGYRQTRPYRYAGVGPLLRQIDRELICQLSSELQRRGVTARFDPATPVLRIGDTMTVVTVVLPYMKEGKTGRAGWWLHFDRVARNDLMLVARTARSNAKMLDCHLLPFPLLSGPTFRFPSENMAALARYRLNSMADFWNVFNDCFARPRGNLCG